MDSPALETVVRIPWGASLLRTLETFPQHSEVDPDARQSPAIPAVRVSAKGAVAVLNHLGGGYAPADELRWWLASGDGEPRASATPYPFAGSRDAVLAIDFRVDDTGRLTLLEKVANAEGRASSRLAVVGPTGEVAWKGPLDGGPYLRLVPDDAGALFLWRGEDHALVPIDPRTGQLGAARPLVLGSRAAVAADRGVVLSASTSADRIGKPAGIADALVFLFGVDGDDDYYTVSGGELLAVTFAGQVRSRLALDGVPALVAAAVGPKEIQARPAPTASWQVDRVGRVYVPRVTPEELQVVRVTLPR